MKIIYSALYASYLLFASLLLTAQCADHEVALNFTFFTGTLGGDTQWSITNDETEETYAHIDFGTYNNHDTIQTRVCVPKEVALTLIVTCCFNNEGSFFLELLGDTIASSTVFQFDNTYSFVATPSLERDVHISHVAMQEYALTQPHQIRGILQNLARQPIQSLDLHWKIEAQTPQSSSFTDLRIPPFSAFEFVHPIIWEASEGTVILKVWADNINGQNDQQTENDSWQQQTHIHPVLGDRIILLESFTNASCNSCAFIDMDFTVLILGNLARTAPINYHTSFPGFDPMYWDNPTDAMERTSYYQNIKPIGTPTTIVEGGKYFGNTGQFNLFQIGEFKAKPALFSFELNEQIVITALDTIVVIDAYVTPHISIKEEDIRLFVVITEELVEFEGSAGGNGLSDFYYVMRQMLPDFNGQALEHLSINQIQHQQFSYTVPKHVQPNQLRTIVFVQNNQTQEIYQAFRTDQPSGTYQGSTTAIIGTNFGQVQVRKQPPSCWNSQDGSIQVTAIATDGNTDFTYDWNTGETGEQLSGLQGGNYTVQIKTPTGQSDEIRMVLPTSEMILETVVIDDKDGLGIGEATVTITPTNHLTPPFTYQWNNGQTTATATHLTTGNYTVTVESLTGCQQTIEVAINNTISSTNTTEMARPFRIYPNPTAHTALLHLPTILKNQETELQVFNIAGQLILKENRIGKNIYLLEVSHWETGMYWVKVVGKKEHWVERLVVVP